MNARPVHVTSEDFEREVLKATEPVVVDFWAPWCGPCKAIGPILDELAGKYAGSVKVAKVNVDEEQALAASFRIRGIPTLFIIENGKATGQIVGFSGRGALEALFEKLSGAEEPREAAAQA